VPDEPAFICKTVCVALTMKQLVSILIPAYNAQKWIADTLQSALEQSWEPKEIIVVDDGSSDDTVEVARSFEARGVRVFTQKNRGAAAARNAAFYLSQGEYIQWLDADDLLARDKIAAQMKFLEVSPSRQMLLSCAWGRFLYRHYRPWFQPDALWCDLSPMEWLLRKMEQNLFMQTATWLVSRELTEAAGPWDESLSLDDDGEYFCRVILKCSCIKFIRDAEVYYRVNGASTLSTVTASKLDSQWKSMRIHVRSLRMLEDSERVKTACLKYLQRSLICFYPERPEIVEEAQGLAGELGGQVQVPPMPWKYAPIELAFGYGAAKHARYLFPQIKRSLIGLWDKTLYRIETGGRRRR
jgi:glycosyltransferase involved in cell wall biosynthesis